MILKVGSIFSPTEESSPSVQRRAFGDIVVVDADLDGVVLVFEPATCLEAAEDFQLKCGLVLHAAH